MKKLIVAVIGLAFAFAITSCNDQTRKCRDSQKCKEKEERHSRRW